MRRAEKRATPSFRRAMIGPITVAIAGVALVAGCSSGTHRTGPVSTKRQTTASTNTTAPTTTTTSTTATTVPSTTYRVRRGDTLTSIAKQFHIPSAAIVFVNRLAQPDRLADGQVLKIPRTSPLLLVITPAKGPPGQRFQLDLIGLTKSERIRFEIDSPAGKHLGPPHVASADGAVRSTYLAAVTDPIGTYKVSVNRTKGPTAKASFRVIKK